MESPPRPPGPLRGPWLLGLLLCPWTLRLAGGQSVIHTGAPILVSLANEAISFSCSITYPYTPKFKIFRLRYFHVDLQGQKSDKKPTNCQAGPGTENQTHTTQCQVTLKLPGASATGTYYCSVDWPDVRKQGNGTFILVRDTGYREPPPGSQKVLFFCFIGILSVLSVLGTALLLWKKKQMWAPRKQLARKGPAPSTAGSEQPPAESESVYTALQRRDTEVYACMQHEASSPPPSQSVSQEKLYGFENDSDFNMVYENL